MEKKECIIKCNPQRELVTGYTKVKVMPSNYSRIILISGATGKTIQEVVDELLSFAIDNAKIELNNGVVTDFIQKEGRK